MDLGERLARIERLGRLRASGVLSDEEFAAEKAKLLPPEPSRVAEESLAPAQQAQFTADFALFGHDYGAGFTEGVGSRVKWAVGAVLGVVFAIGAYLLLQPGEAAASAEAPVQKPVASTTIAQPSPGISREQLIGTWTPDSSCLSDAGFNLSSDGSVGYEDGSGEWHVAGNQLVTIFNGERTATDIIAIGNGRLDLRYPDGAIDKLHRCSSEQVAAERRRSEADTALDNAADAVQRAMNDVDAQAIGAQDANLLDPDPTTASSE